MAKILGPMFGLGRAWGWVFAPGFVRNGQKPEPARPEQCPGMSDNKYTRMEPFLVFFAVISNV
jgi:hypothetical protein